MGLFSQATIQATRPADRAHHSLLRGCISVWLWHSTLSSWSQPGKLKENNFSDFVWGEQYAALPITLPKPAFTIILNVYSIAWIKKGLKPEVFLELAWFVSLWKQIKCEIKRKQWRYGFQLSATVKTKAKVVILAKMTSYANTTTNQDSKQIHVKSAKCGRKRARASLKIAFNFPFWLVDKVATKTLRELSKLDPPLPPCWDIRYKFACTP